MTKKEIGAIVREEFEKIKKMSYAEFEEAVMDMRINRMKKTADKLKNLNLNQTTKP